MRLRDALPLVALLAFPVACDRGEETMPPEPDFGPDEPAPVDDGPLILSEKHEGPLKVMLSLADNAAAAPEGTKLQLEVFSDREKFPNGKVLVQEQVVAGPGPFAFEFDFPMDQYDETNPYGVSALAFDAEGNIFYMTKPVAIYKVGEPKEVYQLQLDPATPEATKAE